MAAPRSGRTSNSAPSLSAVNDDFTPRTTSATVTQEGHDKDDYKGSSTDSDKHVAAKEKRRGMFASYQHSACLQRVNFASRHHPSVKFLLESINKLGSEFVIDKQVSCERCTADTNVSGGFDPIRNEIIVCENRCPTQRLTSMLLTHELVHAYDHGKTTVDWTDLRAVACSEIRAANLSGDCSFLSEKFYRRNIGAKYNHKACVKRLAVSSIIATRNLSKEDAEKIVDNVSKSCFHVYEPFNDIPYRVADIKFSRFSKYYDPR